MPKRYLPLLLAGMIACAQSGEPATLPPASDQTISYGKHVKSILAHNCFECHGGQKKKGGLSMTSREALLKGGESGVVVVPGKSAESRLIKLVAGLDPEIKMPPKGEPLSKADIGTLRAWIDQGLKWDEPAVSREQKIQVAPRVVAVPGAAAGKNPIDLLLAPYFAKNKIVPARISDAVFVRRVYLDVLGLLPTTAQTQEFLADAQPDKREKLIQKLLADNVLYSAHWITFWSDLLRNGTTLAGIDGFKNVNVTPWLQAALEKNMPYNQFVSELVNPKPETEAFIKGVRMRGVVPQSQIPEMQAAQNIAQVFLGVQLKCAACHDSFVSRFALDDSYGMASIFTDKPLQMVRCEIPTGKTATVRFLYPELGTIDGALPKPKRLEQLAQLLTKKENGQFTRTLVNRLWARMLGRGLVEPVDEMESPPWNADVLDWLAADFADGGYDMRKTMERILTSKAYQMPTVDIKDLKENYVFRGPQLKRMTAEQFLDGVFALTGDARRAWKEKSNTLTEALGRPDRNNVATTRETESTTLQSLELMNGPYLQSVIYGEGIKKIKTWPATANGPDAILERFYAHALSRKPTPAERKTIGGMPGGPLSPELIADLLWVVVNLPEFQLIK